MKGLRDGKAGVNAGIMGREAGVTPTGVDAAGQGRGTWDCRAMGNQGRGCGYSAIFGSHLCPSPSAAEFRRPPTMSCHALISVKSTVPSEPSPQVVWRGGGNRFSM